MGRAQRDAPLPTLRCEIADRYPVSLVEQD